MVDSKSCLFEFVVFGTPVSGAALNPQQRRAKNAWRDHVAAMAQSVVKCTLDPCRQECAVVIIYCCLGETDLDLDNLAKTTLDALKGIAYVDDGLISEAIFRKSALDRPENLRDPPPVLADGLSRALQEEQDLTYFQLRDAPDHRIMP